ncbi:ATPase subunit of ABC transporter [Elusimicrobium simillimum]|uniref:ABC-F family ATP-binding cassette domain-containing protein n=1 Tax=Elusimicrobium simillimum TaxID=3143438 RepID=UPI003C6EE6CC
MHKPINLKNLSLSFNGKVLFAEFSAQIQPGDRIAIIGRNGTGKTTLLKIINGVVAPSEGEVVKDKDTVFAYVPQVVQDYNEYSGGERFNKALTTALAQNPDVLLLDEPTNHLDARNRRSLMQMLRYFPGTLIVVSHDKELLNSSVNTLWHINNGTINTFTGNYDDYFDQMALEREMLEGRLDNLSKEKKEIHKNLMKEQKRAKSRSEHGANLAKAGRWAPIVAGGKKRQAQNTAGAKAADINARRDDVSSRLSLLYIPEVIVPKFSIGAADVEQGTIVIVTDGSVGYDTVLLRDINFSLTGTDRMAIVGDNASGKTTILKALLGVPGVTRGGSWTTPKHDDIGYIDQHYSNLDYSKTVLENISAVMPGKKHEEVRDFLNDFLFRKQEEVNKPASVLSGGEKARLSLALVAAKTPKLLILDEITNNVDLETKDHIVQVLREYPAALIAVSHEAAFLDEIGIIRKYDVTKLK